MADIRSFSKDFITEFIELYKAYPCLWKTKSKDYMNRNKKNEAYKVLLEKLQEVEKKCHKRNDSKRSGTGTDDVYVPHLWYYDLLLFGRDQEIPRQSVSNIEDPREENYETQTSEIENEDVPFEEIAYDIEERSISSAAETQPSSNSRPSTSQENRTPCSSDKNREKRKRKGKCDIQQTDDILSLVGERLRANDNDQCTIFGKNVAAKLRGLAKETRLYTEKLINDLLFEAEIGNVTNQTTEFLGKNVCDEYKVDMGLLREL
ncbi:hypothetical protein NQ317_014973 [Molorchus minor]|uniref:MADF domain-containing protein n=1 Tax=Molorchus minor TaxID=1323400 RepID=A0ABQ9J221_9CUCU|nr:hypothetical protein NQ317_014973 [Molorchus minor]